MSKDEIEPAAQSAWRERGAVRAFYSGHSLSDGVPELVEQIARARGHTLAFEVQTAGYSLLRERTRGSDPHASEYSGYRSGNNRQGSGLDVASELRAPKRLGPGERYDALVVTERHDLPVVACDEQTATYLVHAARQLLAGNPEAEIYLYHTWLELDVSAPRAWIAYEKSVRRLWECVASRANLALDATAVGPRVRVLPGGSALAELVEALWDGKVPGLARLAPAERVKLLFRDNVHPSDTGRYYLALVHYAVLYGQSPEGAALPAGIEPELGTFMQQLAARHVRTYGAIANAAARRSMAFCREVMQREICAAYHQLRSGSGLVAALKRKAKVYDCQRSYAGADDPDNPFRNE